MELKNYTVDIAGADWSVLLQEWRWLLRWPYKVWMVTKAGDVLLTTTPGTVHMLDVGQGELREIGPSKEDVLEHICKSCKCGNWLMNQVVDKLSINGVKLGPGDVYSYKVSPALGGTYAADNRMVMSLKQHFDTWGKVHGELAKQNQ
jgi:hypothetical protein